MCTFGQACCCFRSHPFSVKVHIWSSLLDFTQIINAVIIHLQARDKQYIWCVWSQCKLTEHLTFKGWVWWLYSVNTGLKDRRLTSGHFSWMTSMMSSVKSPWMIISSSAVTDAPHENFCAKNRWASFSSMSARVNTALKFRIYEAPLQSNRKRLI